MVTWSRLEARRARARAALLCPSFNQPSRLPLQLGSHITLQPAEYSRSTCHKRASSSTASSQQNCQTHCETTGMSPPHILIVSFHIPPTHPSTSSNPTLRAPNLPHQIRDANLLARLLVVVEPLALVQLDRFELGIGLFARGEPLSLSPSLVPLPHISKKKKGVDANVTHISLKLHKLQPPTIEL